MVAKNNKKNYNFIMNKRHATEILKIIPELLSSSGDVELCMQLIIDKAKNILDFENIAIYYISEENAYLKVASNDKIFTNFNLSKELFLEIEEKDFIKIDTNYINFTVEEKNAYIFPLKIKQTVFGFIMVINCDVISDISIDCLKSLASVASYSIKDSELSNVFKIQLKALQSSIIDKTIAVKTIKEQNEKILEADKAKNEFIANISHELRTPLNAIIGFSEVLGSKIFGELNEKQAEYINDIYTSGVHLLGMINEILDISKLESNAMKITYSEFVPDTAINEVISVMQPLANKKFIKMIFESETSKKVSLDYQKFQQILYNLLSNAIKFTPENGKIKINIKEKNNNIIVSVEDTGKGIEKEHQAKIFDKFVQLENTYTKTGSSTGLGLTITKRFVEMMNGSISIESEINKGAKFIITLPMENMNV